MALSKTTQDHDTIREWAEKRGAKPAEVASTHSKNQTGILRFCFPDAPNHKDASLREISWDEFFEKFDKNNLELIYQEVTAEGAQSNFNKLIYPEDEHHSSRSAQSAGKSHSSSSNSSGSHASSHTEHKSATPGRSSASTKASGKSGQSHTSATAAKKASSSTGRTSTRSATDKSHSSGSGKTTPRSHKAA